MYGRKGTVTHDIAAPVFDEVIEEELQYLEEKAKVKTELEAKTQERGFIIRGGVRFELTR